ncbi:type I-C CRISPR-associated protein Cas8c/Csd1 [Spirochaetota bacterium]
MILQELKNYYDRKSNSLGNAIAPEGWEWKEIPFVLVIRENGTLVNIEDTREGEGKKKTAKRFLVPMSMIRTVGISANLLWDTSSYVFGLVDTSELKTDKAAKVVKRLPAQKKAFVDRIKTDLQKSTKRDALINFLETIRVEDLEKFEAWPEIYKNNANVSFRFEKEKDLFCRSDVVAKSFKDSETEDGETGICLISGEQTHISILHSSIKGVYGAQATGANIVSFNLAPFCSFGKTQGYNAPISKAAMFSYTTALNNLLAKNSEQRMLIGDATVTFWSEKKTNFENDFAFFFKEPEKDNPDAGAIRIKALLESPQTGAYYNEEGDLKFFILGISPNAARLSIRFWETSTISVLANRIRMHFTDLAIVKPPNEPLYYSIWRLLVNISTQDKSENTPPNIAGDFMRSILQGTVYPHSLLQLALRRIKSDTQNRVKPVRAALIKAYLNRYLRVYPNTKEKELAMALDTKQPSEGYQLGRLFASLEKIQEEANPGLNATIRERYYGAACSTPVTVFGTLMRLKNHHLSKLENKGRITNFEKLLAEIVSNFNDFPAHLNLHEQGKFAIGYYHQRQDFFTKKEDKENK